MVQIRGNGFLTEDVVTRLENRSDINQALVRAVYDAILFATALLARLPASRQESAEEKQKIIAVVMLTRLIEISESTFLLASHGVREELQSLFRVFLDAYFLLANVCLDAAFVPVYFRTDLPARLKLMRGGAQRDDEMFRQLNDYATDEIRNELDQFIRQERIEAFNSFAYARRAGCESIYDSIYRLSSASIHSTPRCLEHYVEIDVEGNIVSILHSGNNESIHRALHDVHYFLSKALHGIHELFELPNEPVATLDKQREAAMGKA